ncbi:MAG: Membrane-associated zinc metalloprotease [Parcubacteria group bacterium GW2011_GWE2_39_37]|uniref:Zinc metalloprotease n=1 Tax=Candidatus Falkowbacteria bacterium GW2011_GWF2_39_8 TaxID=1618642 RepID=A0A0G0Q3C9_9BACT|nr:MAG: Membrane-associated zinc metalloprotease [Parcubacteria group bacterium GW2011_GWE2_39_37]KKR31896.1 MAG: Membrane-associated zinc metalloprotease [Candidatus Falkowbacteria bacterium GW2011_GWF2_39_8]
MLTTLIFLIVLSVLVFVHELGHFFTARKFGIKAEEFGIGFPPRAYGVYKSISGKWKRVRGSKTVDDAADTIYSLNWLPLGGFVKIKGEDGENVDPDSFASKKIWQRAIVLSAGVFMNMVLATVLISIGLMIGSPQALDGLGKGAIVKDQQIQVVQVAENSPAKQAGIIPGDIILGIDEKKFATFQEIQNFVDENKDKVLNYKIKRNNEELNFKIKPEIREETGKGGVGVVLVESGTVRYPWYAAIWQGIKQTALLTWAILVAFYELFRNLFTGQSVGADVAGPIGIAKLTGQVARLGIMHLIQFTALLSINLAIINFLPIPALDGGRILFLIIEKIKGKPVKKEVEAIIHNVFFLLLMALILVITFKDVLGLFR